MRDIPSKIATLGARVATLEADPASSKDELKELRALLARKKATQQAVALDKTPGENLTLEGESTLAVDGEPSGPAHDRERDRADFYDHFWARKQGLDAAAKAPQR